jgi:hypothetical protein
MWAKRLPSTTVEWLWDRFWIWMATPEAGNLAMWVGAVGTTGVLLLGLHLLRRDREANVAAQADQVSDKKLAVKAEPG